MSSSSIVSTFNSMARALNTAYTNIVPYKPAVQSVGNFIKENFGADGFKTFVAKPIALVGQTLTYVKSYKDKAVMEAIAKGVKDAGSKAASADYPSTMCAAGMASAAKTLISAVEVFTKLPKLAKELSTQVDGQPEYIRGYRDANGYNSPEPFLAQNASNPNQHLCPQWTPIEAVSNRLFWLAGWIISVGDTIAFAKQCNKSLPAKIENSTPWIYTIAGGYMGLQQLWAEVKVAKGTWADSTKQAVSAEKHFGILSIATNVAYIFNSVMGAVGIYCKDGKNVPAWFGKMQFAANTGVIILPAVQKAARVYMEKNIWV